MLPHRLKDNPATLSANHACCSGFLATAARARAQVLWRTNWGLHDCPGVDFRESRVEN
jgi:hypothetical protein